MPGLFRQFSLGLGLFTVYGRMLDALIESSKNETSGTGSGGIVAHLGMQALVEFQFFCVAAASIFCPGVEMARLESLYEVLADCESTTEHGKTYKIKARPASQRINQ